ncbi:MAG: Snf7 family protein [Candidatus Bathyarchaeota archaeon]|nr:Snf7 family protein [Candidatus Bathyarchaeota archaeon]
MSFSKKWEKKDDPSAYDKLAETINPSDPLKSRLVASVRRIDLENQRLDQAYARFEKREKELFDKVTEAYKAHDKNRANIYANEVTEIRKIERMILQSKLALEQIALRMRTSTELGDVAASLLPVVDTMNDLKTGIASISPQTEKSLGSLGDLLTGMVADAGLVSMGPISFETVNEGTSEILGEAQIVAENKMNETFPKAPRKTSDNYIGEDNSKP